MADFSSLWSPLRPLTLASLFLWLLVAILLLSAAASPKLATESGTDIGAFQICYPDGGGCHSIDANCKIDQGSQSIKILDGSDCSNLQATRAFLIMALLLSFVIVGLTWFMFFAHRMADRALYLVAHVLMALVAFFVLIAFSAAAAVLNKYDFNKGDAFGCLVAAWVIGLLAWALWAAAGRYEQEGVSGMNVATGMATTQPKSVSMPSGQGVGTASANQAPPPYGGQTQPSYQPQPIYQPQPQQPNQPQLQPSQTTMVQQSAAPQVDVRPPGETDGYPY